MGWGKPGNSNGGIFLKVKSLGHFWLNIFATCTLGRNTEPMFFQYIRVWETDRLTNLGKLENSPSACNARRKVDLSTSTDVCRCVHRSVSCTRCRWASAAWDRRVRPLYAARWTGRTPASDRARNLPATPFRPVSAPCETSSYLRLRPPSVLMVPEGHCEALGIDDCRLCFAFHPHPSQTGGSTLPRWNNDELQLPVTWYWSANWHQTTTVVLSNTHL